MKEKQNKLTNSIILLAVAIFLFGSGYKYAEWKIKKGAIDGLNYKIFNSENNKIAKENESIDFNLFWDTWSKLEQKYIDKDKVDPEKMYYGAIKGMVASVEDPYTFFLTPEENQQSKDDLGGKFEGIGAQLGLKDGSIVVVAPLKDSPAIEAGLKSGDIIIKVEDESTTGWTLLQAVNKIRGPEGTQVSLTVLRNNEEKVIEITRQQIKVDSVELSYKNSGSKKVAYIKINQFGDTTNSEWDRAVSEVASKYKSGEIDGMVLDLRGNPGGYLESAVYIASEFLNRGDMIVKQETTTNNDRTYKVQRAGSFLEIPVVTLIDEGSASASEILSGALRDHDRTTLVGKKSFGKGSVQEALDLEGNAGLHVTIAKWILPNGDWINGKGIEPDVEVSNEVPDGNTITDESDSQLKKAIEILSD